MWRRKPAFIYKKNYGANVQHRHHSSTPYKSIRCSTSCKKFFFKCFAWLNLDTLGILITILCSWYISNFQLYINNWDYLYDVNYLYIIEYCTYKPKLFIYKWTKYLYLNDANYIYIIEYIINTNQLFIYKWIKVNYI